jgi:polyhydroxybutyrate depolymerase
VAASGPADIQLRHGGLPRRYLLQVPPDLDGPAALVLELHGRGVDPIRFDQWTGFLPLAARRRFVLALPEAIAEVWNDGRWEGRPPSAIDDLGFLDAVIADVGARARIDPRRVYLVGMSNGAVMAGRYACSRGQRIAAFAQVAGTAAVPTAAACAPGAPVPLVSIHGTADRPAPYDGGSPRGLLMRLLLRPRADPVVGVEDWLQRWRAVNGCDPAPETEQLPPDTIVRRWRGPTPASDVVAYRVERGGHVWPGSVAFPKIFGHVSLAFDATAVIWGFFSSHPRAGSDA